MNANIAVKPGDGFEHWHHVTCRRYSITECRPIRDAAFRASVSICPFGPLHISEIWSSVDEQEHLRVVRGAGEIQRDGRDDFMLWLSVGGRTAFEQQGRCVDLSPGDMMLHDQARPFVLEFGVRSHTVMITIPRSLLTTRLPQAESLTARRINGASALAALAGGLSRECLRAASRVNEDVASRLSGAALDLWSSVLDNELSPGAAGSASRPRRRLEQAKRYMLARLEDADLDIQRVADAQHMSVRTLVRLFALDGETPMRWLWGRRLDASYRLLAECRVTRVADAGLACGFRDMSHFSRAFRAAFACAPHEVLQPSRRMPEEDFSGDSGSCVQKR